MTMLYSGHRDPKAVTGPEAPFMGCQPTASSKGGFSFFIPFLYRRPRFNDFFIPFSV
jgi:hypothetical protein